MKNKLVVGFADNRHGVVPSLEFRSSRIDLDVVAGVLDVQADFADLFSAYGGEVNIDHSRKAVVNSDTGQIYNVVSNRYSIHQFDDVLVRSTRNLLSLEEEDLSVSAVGTTDYGAVGFVQVQLPSSVVLESDTIRPTLTIATSHNGKFATQYKLGLDRLHCSNQLGSLSASKQNRYSFRHTLNSHINIEAARGVLGLMVQAGNESSNKVEQLMSQQFTDGMLAQVIDKVYPHPDTKAANGSATATALTRWETKVSDLWAMYYNDPRVCSWKDTAWGVYQLFSTYKLWKSATESSVPFQKTFNKNMLSYIGGSTDSHDQRVLDVIKQVSLQGV